MTPGLLTLDERSQETGPAVQRGTYHRHKVHVSGRKGLGYIVVATTIATPPPPPESSSSGSEKHSNSNNRDGKGRRCSGFTTMLRIGFTRDGSIYVTSC